MARLLLIILLLVGSPREIANRIVKHGHILSVPPVPRASKIPTPSLVSTQALTLTLSFDNTNSTEQQWVIESTSTLNPPVWKVISDGIIPAGGTIELQIDNQQPRQFYRAGFVWP